MPAAAVVAAAVVSAYASNQAAKKQAAAADRATESSAATAERNRADQLALLAQQRADQAPFREAGYRTLSQIMAGVQPGGEFDQRFGLSQFQTDPGYQFRLEQGQKALDRSAAASGSAYSGAQLKALANFNSGLASQEYGNAYNRFNTDQSARYNRLASVAGLGQTALNQTQQAGTNAYGNIANLGMASTNAINQSMADAAAARASGYVGVSNAIGSGIRNLYNNNAFGANDNSYLTPTQSGYTDLNNNAMNQTENFNQYGSGYSP